MEVILLSHTPEPERIVAAAARVCYSAVSADELVDRLTDAEIRRLIRMLRERGHLSPFEHVSFTFSVSGISRACLAQITRHRLASFSVRSLRWNKSANFPTVMPPSIRDNPLATQLFKEHLARTQEVYNRLVAMGIHQEDARYVLSQATAVNMAITVNLRELMWIARLRTCSRAHWEVRALVHKMIREARKVAPLLLENVGPPCQTDGKCSEGEMSCGRIDRIKLRQQRKLTTRLNT